MSMDQIAFYREWEVRRCVARGDSRGRRKLLTAKRPAWWREWDVPPTVEDPATLQIRLKAEEYQSVFIVIYRLAERVGFEPTVEFPLHTLSKRAPSTTRTSLRVFRISSLQASG
jgi:hypothetical protein